MPIILFDLNKDFINLAQKELSEFSEFQEIILSDVRDIQADLYVSPANSFGFMCGGIDKVYKEEMFPGIEQKVKKRIREIGLKTRLNRFYLPIGSAITVDNLIVAPTMFFPGDIQETRNIFWTMKAILRVIGTKTVAVPGLGIGIGKVQPEEAIKQIKEALNHHLDLNPSYFYRDKDNYILYKNICKQPETYPNLEAP